MLLVALVIITFFVLLGVAWRLAMQTSSIDRRWAIFASLVTVTSVVIALAMFAQSQIDRQADVKSSVANNDILSQMNASLVSLVLIANNASLSPHERRVKTVEEYEKYNKLRDQLPEMLRPPQVSPPPLMTELASNVGETKRSTITSSDAEIKNNRSQMPLVIKEPAPKKLSSPEVADLESPPLAEVQPQPLVAPILPAPIPSVGSPSLEMPIAPIEIPISPR